jgi:hypothetical protein
MKVKELIEQLSKLPPEKELVAYEPKSTKLMIVHGMGKTNFIGHLIEVLIVGAE